MDKKKQDKTVEPIEIKKESPKTAVVENDSLRRIEVKEFTIIRFIVGFMDYDVVVVVINGEETQVPIKKGNVFESDKTVKIKIQRMGDKDIVILD